MSVADIAAPVHQANTLDPSQLDGLLRIVTGSNRIDFIPAHHWEYRDDLRAVLYPREAIMGQPTLVTAGQIYQKGGYACHSQGKSDPWRHIDRAVTKANKLAGFEAVAPLSAQAILFALEEERVENRQRSVFPNLENNFLPRRDRGYRHAAFMEDIRRVATPSEAGAMNQATGVPDFWLRAAIAAKLVGSGATATDELPQDMPWPESLVTDITSCCHADTQDEMLITFEKVVAGIAKSRTDSYKPPEPKPEPNDSSCQKNEKTPDSESDQNESSSPEGRPKSEQNTSEKNDESSNAPSNQGQKNNENEANDSPDKDKDSSGPSSSQDTPNRSTPENESQGDADSDADGSQHTLSTKNESVSAEETKPDDSASDSNSKNCDGQDDDQREDSEAVKAAKEQIRKEAEATPKPSTRDPIDFVSGNSRPDKTTEKNTKEQKDCQGQEAGNESRLQPNGRLMSWESIASTTTNIVSPIRRAITQHFRDNESGALVKRLRRGNYDVQTRMADKLQGINRPEVCNKRTYATRKSYEVYFLVDVSASMREKVEGTSVDFRVFGMAENARWMMATRMVVAMSKVFDSINGVRYAIGVHDTEYKHLKDFAEPLRETQRRRILDFIGAYGGTDPNNAYKSVHNLMKKSTCDKKLFIHLTDGEIETHSNRGASQSPIKTLIRTMEKDGIEVVVLTVGMPAERVRTIVGNERADEVTDSSVGLILGKHLKRAMIT